MLLVFCYSIFEAHHQVLALHFEGVLINSIVLEERVLMQATLEGNFFPPEYFRHIL